MEETTRLFFKNVVKYWGLPKTICSESTGQSPFELATGQQPLTSNTLTAFMGSCPSAFKFAKDWQNQWELARIYLNKAAKKMKKWAKSKMRHVEFQTRDLVMVNLLLIQHKSLCSLHKGLLRKYEGPFLGLKRIGKMSYRLELPPKMKIHLVFHVNHLKSYHSDAEDPTRGESSRAPSITSTSFHKEVESILVDREVKNHEPKYQEYFIKWKVLPENESSWESEDSLWQFRDHINRYVEKATRMSPN
ncbi:uncharacterized protein LOC116133756 [Pistacia vera]|uniref:uncharacterized protein LOC116133756 n=1 Tax=Pistacia vera TaxID=55513 RepID=UPI001263CA48|nr:uncharacterized protein LOC116133756 [Pistacia vera]